MHQIIQSMLAAAPWAAMCGLAAYCIRCAAVDKKPGWLPVMGYLAAIFALCLMLAR